MLVFFFVLSVKEMDLNRKKDEFSIGEITVTVK